MTKKKKKIIKPCCNKCGKVAPIDKEKSTNNWKVYMINKPCECGGEYNELIEVQND